nr:hypothetical protein CFP56_21524 [Quercus suber]
MLKHESLYLNVTVKHVMELSNDAGSYDENYATDWDAFLESTLMHHIDLFPTQIRCKLTMISDAGYNHELQAVLHLSRWKEDAFVSLVTLHINSTVLCTALRSEDRVVTSFELRRTDSLVPVRFSVLVSNKQNESSQAYVTSYGHRVPGFVTASASHSKILRNARTTGPVVRVRMG